MANPNRTVAAYRAKYGRSEVVQKAMNEAAERRRAASPFTVVMDKVSRGEMTPEEGAAEVKRMMGDSE